MGLKMVGYRRWLVVWWGSGLVEFWWVWDFVVHFLVGFFGFLLVFGGENLSILDCVW